MDEPVTTLKIQTLGRFSFNIDGKPVATEWPNEFLKVFFCSLLSPLDLYFSWDRICRSMWEMPAKDISKHQLNKMILKPLDTFLVKELEFNPLIADSEGIRIDQQSVHVDAREFYSTVLEALRLFSIADNSAAVEKFSRAKSLYTGSYLPGIQGKIIVNTRFGLEAMYHTAVMGAVPHHDIL
jgi:DNA-binding SARP family transcriptional activator